MKTNYRIVASITAALTMISTPTLCAKESATTAKEVKTEIKKDDAKPYPLDTCIVSDEKLGAMGAPTVIVYQGQEIKFCCKKCKPKFEKEPEKYLKKLEKK